MQRDFFLVDDAPHLRHLLERDVLIPEILGIGFFTHIPAESGRPGIAIQVIPEGLKASLLRAVGAGQLSPLTHEVVFCGGESVIPGISQCPPGIESFVTSWLMAGLPEDASVGLGGCLEVVNRSIMNIRASHVLVMLDGLLLGQTGKEREVIFEVMTWFAEEAVHPSVGFLCSPVWRDRLLAVCRKLRLSRQVADSIRFRFG